MSMALAVTVATAVMMAKAATLAMVLNCLAGMVVGMMVGMRVLMSRTSKHEVDLMAMAMAMGLMVVVSREVDFHAMDLDLQQMAKIAMMLFHQRIGQPPNSVAIGLEQGHVQTICCVR